jgi:hypothetical protein
VRRTPYQVANTHTFYTIHAAFFGSQKNPTIVSSKASSGDKTDGVTHIV